MTENEVLHNFILFSPFLKKKNTSQVVLTHHILEVYFDSCLFVSDLSFEAPPSCLSPLHDWLTSNSEFVGFRQFR